VSKILSKVPRKSNSDFVEDFLFLKPGFFKKSGSLNPLDMARFLKASQIMVPVIATQKKSFLR